MGKRYDEEFKKEIVVEYQNGASLTDIKNNYGISKSTVRGWIKKYDEECQYMKPQKGKDSTTAKEIRELNMKIAELEKENKFLKKAAAFFAKKTD